MSTTMAKFRGSKVGQMVEKLEVNHPPGLTNTELMLQNDDLKVVEPERRVWGMWNFVAFWAADSMNINTWMISSSNIIDGLSWWQSWICVWIGYSLAACFVVAAGRMGAQYRISFPVLARSSFGVWGSLWPVINRVALACVWFGVQSYIGGTTVQLMISSIWRNWDTYATGGVNNTIHAENTNTRDFVSFFFFWLLSLPFLWFPVHKIRHLFTVKAVVVPCAGAAFFIWAIVRAHGIGPVIHQPGTLHGSALGWAVIKGIMSSVANFAALILNNSDYSRFSKTRRDALWPQLFTIPVGFAITSFVGIIVSSSSAVIFGEAVWSPLTLLQKFLDEPGVTSATRFGVFVISAAFALAQLGTNIAANSLAAGTDLAALLPRWLNIRRGSYICALVALVMCPWNLLSSSNNFTTYLSAYSVFLSSIAGVIVSDYYFVRKGYLQVRDLYSAQKSGPYYFSYGFNWRAWAAYVAGILINVVGFAGAVGQKVPAGATYIYNLNYFCGFIVAAAVYWVLCFFFKIPACSETWLEINDDMGETNGEAYDVERASDDERLGTGSSKVSLDAKGPIANVTSD